MLHSMFVHQRKYDNGIIEGGGKGRGGEEEEEEKLVWALVLVAHIIHHR